MKALIAKFKLHFVMHILAGVSAVVAAITLVLINAFGVVALTNVMSAAAFVFIFSGAYLMGYEHCCQDAASEMSRVASAVIRCMLEDQKKTEDLTKSTEDDE